MRHARTQARTRTHMYGRTLARTGRLSTRSRATCFSRYACVSTCHQCEDCRGPAAHFPGTHFRRLTRSALLHFAAQIPAPVNSFGRFPRDSILYAKYCVTYLILQKFRAINLFPREFSRFPYKIFTVKLRYIFLNIYFPRVALN